MTDGDAKARWSYRAHLDGLRAVAVYLVVAFHAGVGRLAGGFIGVDVFFVLSGYLVTNLLLRDLEGDEGRVRFGRFYSRRARRLLPAAAVSLVVTAVVFSALASPVELIDAKGAIRAASLYFANWFFIRQAADYFAAEVDASPVVHYWSLSVEEQFYLLWPLLLSGLFVVARRFERRRVAIVRGAVVVLGLASAGAALHLAGSNLNRAYYGTDTRAYQLLAGAAVALTPGLFVRVRRLVPRVLLDVAVVGLVLGLVVLATTLFDGNAIQRGVLCAVLTCSLIVAVESSPGGLGQRLLSLPPLVYLGKISYGTYLWHWLVIVVLARELDVSHVSTLAIAAGVATGLASLSYQLLEMPIRSAPRLDRLRPVVITSGLALSLLVGLLVAPRLLDRGGVIRADAAAGPEAPVGTVSGSKVDPQWQSAYFDIYDVAPCEKGGIHACELTTTGDKTMIVVGDSHAEQLTPMFTDFARQQGYHAYAGFLPYCPWTRGVRYAGVGEHCFQDQDTMFQKVIPALRPDLVVLVHRPFDDVNEPLDLDDRDQGRIPVGDPRRAEVLRRRVDGVVHGLRRQGATVVMFEPIPVVKPADDTLKCLSKAKVVEQCRFVTSTQPGPEARAMRALAQEDPQVVSVDLDRLVCPYLPICDPVVDGLVVKRDGNHLTVKFGRHLREPFTRILQEHGILRG